MTEKRVLQIALAIAGLVPVTAGAAGALQPELLRLAGAASTMTHVAYLSGLLLGIGLTAWLLVPSIERQGNILSLLTAIVVLGGLARAFTALRLGTDGLSVVLPLVMELGVTPALWLWQRRVARSSNSPPE